MTSMSRRLLSRYEKTFLRSLVLLLTFLLVRLTNRPCMTSLTHLEGQVKGQINPHFDLLPTEATQTQPCELLDFFLASDPTASSLPRDLLCDVRPRSDTVCRIYFRQLGLEHLQGDSCARADEGRVPKVVYFVIFGSYVFRFWHYVALRAAQRFVQPSAIYVIGDQHPLGRWWQKALTDVKGVRFVHRQLPQKISGQLVKFPHHRSDVVRLQTIFYNGGIYLDADMVLVRDIEPLRVYDVTMGLLDNATGMGNAFIMAKRRSPFVREWLDQYRNYNNSDFYWNSMKVPRNMWIKNSSRIHMESERLYRPNWFEAELLFKRTDFPWWNNYAVHVWTNGNPVPESPEEVQAANSTIAQIFRHVLYGDSSQLG